MTNFFKTITNFFSSSGFISTPSLVEASNKIVVESSDSFTHSITIPPRTMTIPGSQFGKIIDNAASQEREDDIYHQCEEGNIPEFMRNPQPVTVSANGHQLTYWVLPDVLCIGTNEDYLRTPLNPITARRVSELFHCVLPTKKMAMQIWAAAAIKLSPIPNGPPYDETMQLTTKFVSHNAKIQAAMGNKILGQLVTGHKKDVVITNKLFSYPNNVAIYGWFYPNGTCIQGLNPVSHNNGYKDYSHGIRLISREMILNGVAIDFYDLLKNQSLANLISDEGNYDATNIYKS